MKAHRAGSVKGDRKDLTSLKEIISGLLNDSNLPFNPEDKKIFEIWEETVGALVNKHARPIWIEKGRLRVNVTDSIWIQELEFAKNTIIKKINSSLGREAVEKIEFRLGGFS
ncbi:MAG: DUF721 domain-containing protein [Deltaproteobacteria bacterium]|nr:DUF721 domain-containing protein [Deltaproteobacteria bacterium]